MQVTDADSFKNVEIVIEELARQQVDNIMMQFIFMSRCGTAHLVFILRQLHKKYLAKYKNTYVCGYVGSFDQECRDFLQRDFRELTVE